MQTFPALPSARKGPNWSELMVSCGGRVGAMLSRELSCTCIETSMLPKECSPQCSKHCVVLQVGPRPRDVDKQFNNGIL